MNARAVGPSSLTELETAVWRELARAPRDKHHEWRNLVLATTDGEVGDARTVVLREVDAQSKRLMVFTDQRSAKVQQMLDHPQGTLVMWSARLGWQLRCRVTLTVEFSGLAVSSRWARVMLSPAAQDYLSPLPPGAALTQKASPSNDGTSTDAVPPDDAHARLQTVDHPRAHFAVVHAQVQSLDWLELRANGHRRALLTGTDSRWIQA